MFGTPCKQEKEDDICFDHHVNRRRKMIYVWDTM